MAKIAEIMSEGLYSEGVLCDDCLLWLVNRDDSGASADWSRDAANETLERYLVTALDDREEFSSTECGMCGTYLAGRRTEAQFVERTLLD